MELTRGTIDANGLEFAFLEAGAGPLALCLHGFPDSPHSFDDGCVGADVAAGVPGVVIVEGAGHFLHLEQPAQVNRLILQLLSS